LIVFEVIRPSVEEMRKRPGMAIHYALQHDLSHQKLIWSRVDAAVRKAGFRASTSGAEIRAHRYFPLS
jgi:hypothetical protein